MSSAPVKVVQSLARHSTPTLTLGIYAHVGLFDQTGALDALPDLSGPTAGPEAASLAATGTDGCHISDRVATHLPLAGDGTGRDVADGGGMTSPTAEGTVSPARNRNPLEMEILDASRRDLAGTDAAEGVGFEPTVGL